MEYISKEKPGVLLRGALTSYSGYGTATLALIEQLDKYVNLGLIGIEATNGMPMAVANILARPLVKRVHCFIDVVPPFSAQGRLRETFSVLYSMVETNRFTGNVDFDLLKTYHLIIVANKISQQIFGDLVGIDKVKVVPLGIDTKFFSPVKRKLDGEIRFACVGYMNKRKGIDITIKAFKQVRKKYKCTLDIHTTGVPLLPEFYAIDGLNIIAETINREELRQFYYDHDVLVCSSRGEGANMPATEMLSTGGSVIGSKWAGHEMFMDEAYAYPVRHKMVYTNKKLKVFGAEVKFIDRKWITPGTMWAEPILKDIISAMMDICENRDKLRQKMDNTYLLREKMDIEKIAKDFWNTVLQYKYNSQDNNASKV